MSIAFTLPIAPVAKGRPRLGNGHAFTPARTRKFEEDFALLSRCHMPRAPLEGPLRLRMLFGMPTRTHEPSSPHTFRPDLDNLLKAMDALNGIAWRDDAQIFDIHATKLWTRDPSIHIVIEEG